MRKGSRIGVGLLLLIPVGFAIKWWLQPETLLLFSIVVSLAINIVILNVMSDLVALQYCGFAGHQYCHSECNE